MATVANGNEGLVLHHLENSRSQRILWLLEELELPYTIKKWERVPSTQRVDPTLKDVHQMGKVPTITDNGVVISESGAIVEYLIDKYDEKGKFQPAPEAKLTNLYYNHFSEGSLMSNVVFTWILTHVAPGQTPFIFRPLVRIVCSIVESRASKPNIKTALEMIEDHLSKVPSGCYIAGGPNLTSADFMMLFPLEVIKTHAPDQVAALRHVNAYVDRIHASPAYKRGIEKGGKYTFG